MQHTPVVIRKWSWGTDLLSWFHLRETWSASQLRLHIRYYRGVVSPSNRTIEDLEETAMRRRWPLGFEISSTQHCPINGEFVLLGDDHDIRQEEMAFLSRVPVNSMFLKRLSWISFFSISNIDTSFWISSTDPSTDSSLGEVLVFERLLLNILFFRRSRVK